MRVGSGYKDLARGKNIEGAAKIFGYTKGNMTRGLYLIISFVGIYVFSSLIEKHTEIKENIPVDVIEKLQK